MQYLIERIYGRETVQNLGKIWTEASQATGKGHEEYTKRGAHFIFPTLMSHPFFALSLHRSMVKFTEDLYYRPEMVEKVLQKMTDEWITNALAISNPKRFLTMGFVDERASGFFYPLEIFERFWWP